MKTRRSYLRMVRLAVGLVFASAPGWAQALPRIIEQPQDQYAPAGTEVVLRVVAEGDGPLSYQWFHNQTNALVGATNATLTVPLRWSAQMGWYSVRVRNAHGEVFSAPARVHLVPLVSWGMEGDPQGILPVGLSNVVAIDSGRAHNLALTADGRVVAWGVNSWGQTEVPAGLSNVVAIAAGAAHSLALTAEGRVVAWGYNLHGQANVPPTLSNVVGIAAGYLFSLALTADGQVVGWGTYFDGRVYRPWVVPPLTNVVSIAAGGNHALALLAGGRVVAWGRNTHGQTNVPANLSDVVAIAGGGFHSLALRADGRVVAWGSNGQRQTSVPADLSHVVDIAAGDFHSLALRADGQVVAWGRAHVGQTQIPAGLSNGLSLSAGEDYSLALVGYPPGMSRPQVLGPKVRLGYMGYPFYARVVAANGVDRFEALGLPVGLSLDPATGVIAGVPDDAGVFDVTLRAINPAGVGEATLRLHLYRHPLVIQVPPLVVAAHHVDFNRPVTLLNGPARMSAAGLPPGLGFDPDTERISGRPTSLGDFTVQLTASNRFEVLTHTFTLRVSPVLVLAPKGHPVTSVPPGLDEVVDLAAGGAHALALTKEGRVVAWGENRYGQSQVPPDLTNVTAIAAGENHSLALTAAGQVVAWGFNGQAQTNVPPGLSNVVAVAAGRAHSLALTAQGRVVGWGENSSGQTGVPAGLSNVVAIAAGAAHSLALTAKGQVVGWGTNGSGQLTVPAGLSNVVAIAAGANHSLALTETGQVIAWGDNSNGQCRVPEGLSNVVAIAAGWAHSLARTADGRLVGWGSNRSGEISIPPEVDHVGAMVGGGRGTAAESYLGFSLALLGHPPGLFPPRVLAPRVALGFFRNRFFAQVAAANGVDRFEAVGLPAGLRLDPATGVIAGVPDDAGVFDVTLRAINPAGVGEATLRLHLYRHPLVIQVPPLLVAAHHVDFNRPVTLLHGPAQLSAEGLPPGLGFDPETGRISGRPTSLGDFTVQLTASNRFEVLTHRFTLRVSPVLVLAPEGLPVTFVPADLREVVDVAAGGAHALALTAAGRVVAWGWNGWGQANVPVGLNNVVAIAAGAAHSLALTADGRVVAWGYDFHGLTNVPPGLRNVVAIAAGGFHNIALTAEGQVVVWGSFSDGQGTIPVGLSNVVAVAAGDIHSLFLTADRRLRASGYYRSNFHAPRIPLPPELPLSNAVAVASGTMHTLVLTPEARVQGWGVVNDDRLTPPEELKDVLAIAAGDHSLALTAQGRVISWGPNAASQNAIFEGINHAVAVSAWGGLSVVGLGLPPGQAPPRVLGPKALAGTAGRPFYARIRVANGAESFMAQGLPSGLTLDAASGVISGVPDEVGEFRVILLATNARGTGAAYLRLHINRPEPGFVLKDRRVILGLGQEVQYAVPTVNARWVQVTGLPPGLTWDPIKEQIQGQPTLPGDYQVSLTVGNEYATNQASLILNVWQVLAWGNNQYGQCNTPGGLSNVVAVAGGVGEYSLALRSDGRIVGWGYNEDGRRTIPAGLSNVVAISAGWLHGLGLTAEGRVVAWGVNDRGQTRVPENLPEVVAVAAGGAHGLALTSEGRVVAWGDNSYRQCDVPAGLSNVVAIAAGAWHSLGLTVEGRVVAWGDNSYRQCDVPSGLSNVVAIAAGGWHSLALTADGRVVAWGVNDRGQTRVPADLPEVAAVAAGGAHSLALTAEGRVVGWGQATVPAGLNRAVDIGAGSYHSLALLDLPPGVAPPQVLGPRALVAYYGLPLSARVRVANGADRFEALGLPRGVTLDPITGLLTGRPAETGLFHVTLRALNSRGMGETSLRLYVNAMPPRIHPDTPAVTFALGDLVHYPIPVGGLVESYTVTGLPPGLRLDMDQGAITGTASEPGDYTVSLTVSNRYGTAQTTLTISISPVFELGPVGPQQSAVPTGTGSTVALAAGAEHTLALTADGRVLAWGDNRRGQTAVPADLGAAVAIAAGGYHSMALTRDGRVRVWGDNGYGQVAHTPELRRVVAIAAGWGHNLALTADGWVTGWGWNAFGQGDRSPGVSNAVAIAAGAAHSLALRADGRVVGWGLNIHGQATPPPDLADVVAVAAGAYHSLALTAEGRVVAWGRNFWGQTDVPEGLTNAITIAAGMDFSLAGTADGRLVAWGNDAKRFSGTTPAGSAYFVAPVAQYQHAVALVVPGVMRNAPRLFVRWEEDWVLLNWIGGRGPFRVWQAWELKPERWTPWGGLRPVPWAAFPAEPDQQFLRVEGR